MPINSFLYPGAKVVPPFTVPNSLRLDGSTSNLSRTKGTSDSTKIGTYSWWIKNSKFTGQNLIDCGDAFADSSSVYISSNNTLTVFSRISNSNVLVLETDREFRDPSAWHNIVVAIDTTQGTSSNRVKVYVDGVQQTSFSTETYPDQNADLRFFTSSETEKISSTIYEDGGYFGGYMCEVVKVDGQALAPTSFGQFNDDSPTIWEPIDVTGLTFGTNGYYLDFEDSSALGNDVSGNDNDFTANNLAAIDQSTDTCTNNFATMNPLAPANISSASEGNLKILQSSSGGSVISTFGFSSGKWYWEVELDSQVNYTQLAGVIKESKMESALLTSFNVGANDGGWGYFLQGNTDNGKAFHNNSASSVYTTMSAGNILSIAVDSDNGKIYFAVNGTYVNSGDPANGTGAVYTNLPTGENLFPAITNYVGSGSTATLLMNFGSPPFSISSGNSDANGFGNFEYAVPSGYFSLCTKNLAEFG